MKLNVVDDYRKVVTIEADTIDTLKARIMESFSLSEEDLSQRLLVRDRRDIYGSSFSNPMVNGFDLLELEEGESINLEDCFCKDCLDDDGDTLLLGWKGSFIIKLVPTDSHMQFHYSFHNSLDIEADPYVTLGALKREIERGTGEPVTEENLPIILFEGDDDKPLIFFGFYKYCKDSHSFLDDNEMVTFRINRNRDNIVLQTLPNYCFYRTELATLRYFVEEYDREEERKKRKLGQMDQYYRHILTTRTYQNKGMEGNIEGMEGDKEDAAPSYKLYQLSKKEREDMDNHYNELEKQGKLECYI